MVDTAKWVDVSSLIHTAATVRSAIENDITPQNLDLTDSFPTHHQDLG